MQLSSAIKQVKKQLVELRCQLIQCFSKQIRILVVEFMEQFYQYFRTIISHKNNQLKLVKQNNQAVKQEVCQIKSMMDEVIVAYKHQLQQKTQYIGILQTKIKNHSNNEFIPTYQRQNINNSLIIQKNLQNNRDMQNLQIIQQVQESINSTIRSNQSSILVKQQTQILPLAMVRQKQDLIQGYNTNDTNVEQGHLDIQTFNQTSLLTQRQLDFSKIHEQKNEINKYSSATNLRQKHIQTKILNDSVKQDGLENVKIKIKKRSKQIQTLWSENKQNIRASLFENINVIQPRILQIRSNSKKSRYGSSQKDKSYSKESSVQKKMSVKKMIQRISSYNYSSGDYEHTKLKVSSLKNPSYSSLRYWKNQLKQQLSNYEIQTFENWIEYKYEGPYRNRLKEGQGEIIYKNGSVYKGGFKKGKKSGKGCIIVDNIIVCEGQFKQDYLHGEANIKSLKLMLKQCHKLSNCLYQCAYSGSFQRGKFHGNGAIYINTRQKIITQFNQGVPVGKLTFYSQNGIQFDSWQ